jgi:hypothetical protein
MRNEEAYARFLRRGGRSASATNRCLAHVQGFEQYLKNQRGVRDLGDAVPEDLEAYVAWIEREPRASARTHLWALRYYFDYVSDEEMRTLASLLRQQRISRRPFPLRDFRGANPDHVDRLADVGIGNAEQMLEAGRTRQCREELAVRTGVPLDAVLEFVKLSDLARIPGVKGIRARLYVDAGADTVAKLAEWDPDELRAMVVEFVKQTGFDGVPTLPAEARFTVERARALPKVVEY